MAGDKKSGLSPHRKTCSSPLRKSAKDKMVYMDNLREKLAKRKSPRRGRNPARGFFMMIFNNRNLANQSQQLSTRGRHGEQFSVFKLSMGIDERRCYLIY